MRTANEYMVSQLSSRYRALRSVAAALAMALMFVACSDGRDTDGGPSAPAADAPLISEGEPLEAGDVADSAPGEGDPAGPQAGTAAKASADRGTPELEVLDPCTLITGEEFSNWSGDTEPADPQSLEQGEACGFISDEDDHRLAVGVVAVPAGGERFVPDDAAGQTLTDAVGIEVERLRWIPGHPIPDSDLLVAEADEFDLVLELTARGLDEEAVRSAALTFMRAAAARLQEALA